MFEIVDDDNVRRRTDAGPWVYYKLTYEAALNSGELIIITMIIIIIEIINGITS